MIPIANIRIENEVLKAVENVLKSGQLAQGPIVEQFENAFANYIGTKYAVAVNSGTAALHVALMAGACQGDEVITTPFSFIASANCVYYCGAVPVFADIEPKTFNIDPRVIESKINPKTKAVIVVHLYGQPCDMDEIVEICKKHNLTLIEDACQAHGAEYKGHKVGTFGIGCFSFYATKNMITGEGGMITTDSEEVARKARMIRHHGQNGRYVHETMGYNYRLTDIAAAIGLSQIIKLDTLNEKRAINARFLSDGIRHIKGLESPYIAPDRTHVFHQFTVKVTKDFKLTRDELQQRLSEQGIGTGIYYPIPIHKQPLYLNLGYKDHLQVSESMAQEVLSLPVYPALSSKELETIVEGLQNA